MTKKELHNHVMIPGGDDLLDRKGLAVALLRGVKYVNAMVRDGFPMPGSRATLNQALTWLVLTPTFRQNRPAPPFSKIAE